MGPDPALLAAEPDELALLGVPGGEERGEAGGVLPGLPLRPCRLGFGQLDAQ